MLKLMLTDRCNLRCSYCYEGEKKKKNLDKRIGQKAIDFYFENFLCDYENVGFLPIVYHGGEPLLEFQLMRELTQYAEYKIQNNKNDKVKSCRFSFTSNGTLLDESMYEFFKKNNFKISISIDGKKEINDKNRKYLNGQGTFDIVMRKAKNLNKVLDDKLAIRMTVMPGAVSSLSDNVQYFLEEGFHRIGIALDYFSNWEGKENILQEQLEILKKIYINYHKQKKTIEIDLFDGKIGSFLIKEPPLFCNAGYGNITIDADGTIYPCAFAINREFSIGNIEKGINYKKYASMLGCFLQQGTNDLEKCKACDISYFCHAQKCGFLNWATTGYLNKSNKVVCMQEKLLFPIIKDIIDTLKIGEKVGAKIDV